MLKRAIDNATIRKIVTAFAVVMILIQMYCLLFVSISPGYLRPLHVAFFCIMAYVGIAKPGKKKWVITLWWVIDTVLILGVIASTVYIFATHDSWIARFTNTMTKVDVFFSVILFVYILIMAQRSLGWPMVILALVFVVYAYFGHYLKGPMRTLPISANKIFSLMYNIQGSYFGSLTGISVTYVLPFVLMGKMMELCGTGDYFTEFANRLTGKSRGGPAKVAVVSTGVFGTISGAGAANAVATGTFTIPLMKKAGYESKFAAGIEAVAAAGGQIMPPIMAAAAFLASEISGISYNVIAISAVVPALIYYINLFITLDFEAGRLDLKGTTEEIAPWKQVLSRWYLLSPVVVIIAALLLFRVTPLRAAGFSMLLGLVLFYVNPKTRQPFVKSLHLIAQAFYKCATSFTSIGISFGCAAIVSSMLNVTGLAVKMTSFIFEIGQGSLAISLILTAVISIILGMGLPVSAAYVIAASVCVGPLTKLGVPLLAAHMFLLHFSSLSTITPPVCLTAYTTAGISGDKPIAVGFQACRIGIVSFIIPFFFAFNQDMLWTINGPAAAIKSLVTAVIGIAGLAAGNIGWLKEPIKWPLRILFIVGGILMIHPAAVTDAIGIVVILATGAVHLLMSKHKADRQQA